MNLQVEQGTVLGFIGPNGAGKTTTVNMLTGILPPTSGTIRLLGLDFEQEAITIKQRIGVVPEDLALFEHLRGREQLYFTSRIYGMQKANIEERTDELFEVFGLQGQEDKFVHEYSKGMKKNLLLCVPSFMSRKFCS
ncbi:ABC transporter ATP-binding protein [candidate division KSB1 bacterium]|nr:ABC transporter ATP-binding protein [candidate division KSB1 bacterium]